MAHPGEHEAPSLSPVDLMAIGGLAGSVEVTLQQPTVTAKNFLQQGKAIPLNPRVLYRGWFVNCASIAPINALQFGANKQIEASLKKLGVQQNSGTVIGSAALSGMISSVVSCPAEMVMLHQQVPTIHREALWVGSYLGLVPVLCEKLGEVEALKDSPYTVWASGSVIGGLIAGTLTHPLDTIKTRMQAHPEPETVISQTMRASARAVLKDGTTFAGFVPRTVRILGACFILNYVKEKTESAVLDYRHK